VARSYEAPRTQVGKLIDRGLRQTGLRDQSKLADRCGVDGSYIVKLKQGKVRFPRPDILLCLAATLNQDIEDYRMAILADSGELPDWYKVLESQEGVRLNAEDTESIRRYVRALVRQRRGKS
jgi:transcriptional regulator with XRE-family HTH domain